MSKSTTFYAQPYAIDAGSPAAGRYGKAVTNPFDLMGEQRK